MKLCYLISQYPALSHTFILNEVTALRANGIEISVASINAPDRKREELTEKERCEAEQTFYIKNQGIWGAICAFFYTLTFHPLGTVKGIFKCFNLTGWNIGALFYHFFYLAEAMILGRWMEKHKLTHLHVHFGIAVSTVALLCKEVFPIQFSMTIHGPDEFYDVDQYHIAEKIKKASLIVCISYFAQSQLMRFSSPEHWSKMHVVPLGVSADDFPAKPINKAPAVFELLSVGRLVPMKGHAILLSAVAQLINQGLPLKLTIIGGGPEKENLEKEIQRLGIESHINLTGPLNLPKVCEHYQKADLFIMSSFSEGIPIVLMEAMASGIPCVASAINGIPELIRNEEEGMLVPASDISTLVATIQSLLSNPEKRVLFSKAGRKRVVEKYNIKINTDKLTDVLRGIVS